MLASTAATRPAGIALVYALHRESEPFNYVDLSPAFDRNSVKQHQKIVKAIANQDEDAAVAAIMNTSATSDAI